MNIGSHIHSKKAIEEIDYRKGNTFQIFISSPMMWKSPKPREDVDILQEYKGNIYVHAPYLLNLPSPNNKVRHPSRKLLKETCKVASTFGAKGVVVHGGSVGEGGDIGEGYENWQHLDFLNHSIRLQVDENPPAENFLGEMRCDPLEALADLVNHLRGRKITLEKGDFISTGAATIPQPFGIGARVKADFGVIGSIEIVFE